jgi:hypothetical protein
VTAAQEENFPVLACDLKAIDPAERPRHRDLTELLRGAVQGRSELPDGYALRLDGSKIRLTEAAEWIALERLCCPFLTFELSVPGGQSGWFLKLTGPKGVKAILEAEFSKR